VAIQANKKDPWRNERVLLASGGLEVKQAEPESRRFSAIISTPRQDRDFDVVEPHGIVFPGGKKKPPVLLHHQSQSWPVGRINRAKSTDDGVLAELEFLPVGILPEADIAFTLARMGHLTSLSIGFLPLEHEATPDRRGRRFTKWELLEVSLVDLPSNIDAQILAELKTAGVSMCNLKKMFPGDVAQFELQLERIEKRLREIISGMANEGKLVVAVIQETQKLEELSGFPIVKAIPEKYAEIHAVLNVAVNLVGEKLRDLDAAIKLLGPVVRELEAARAEAKKIRNDDFVRP
jgi:HK97 family phage prohead protease